MKAAGYKILGDDRCAICPVMIGDANKMNQLCDGLFKQFNIFLQGASYPTVPKGTARIRCQMSSALTTEQVQKGIDAFTVVGKQLGIIP